MKQAKHFLRKKEVLIMASNVTKKDMFNMIKEIINTKEFDSLATREDINNFLDHEIELLEKRNSKTRKISEKKLKENEALSETILEIVIGAIEPLRTMEIAKIVGISPQKATPFLSKLVKAGKVKVEKVKGANVYSALEDFEEVEID